MATATLETLTEQFDLGDSQIDAKAGIVRGVKILGAASKNRRTYSRKAM